MFQSEKKHAPKISSQRSLAIVSTVFPTSGVFGKKKDQSNYLKRQNCCVYWINKYGEKVSYRGLNGARVRDPNTAFNITLVFLKKFELKCYCSALEGIAGTDVIHSFLLSGDHSGSLPRATERLHHLISCSHQNRRSYQRRSTIGGCYVTCAIGSVRVSTCQLVSELL